MGRTTTHQARLHCHLIYINARLFAHKAVAMATSDCASHPGVSHNVTKLCAHGFVDECIPASITTDINALCPVSILGMDRSVTGSYCNLGLHPKWSTPTTVSMHLTCYPDFLHSVELVVKCPGGKWQDALQSVTTTFRGIKDGWCAPALSNQVALSHADAGCKVSVDGDTAFIPLTLYPLAVTAAGQVYHNVVAAVDSVEVQVETSMPGVSVEVWGQACFIPQPTREHYASLGNTRAALSSCITRASMSPRNVVNATHMFSLTEVGTHNIRCMSIQGLDPTKVEVVKVYLNSHVQSWKMPQLRREQQLRGFTEVDGIVLMFDVGFLSDKTRDRGVNPKRIDHLQLDIESAERIESVHITMVGPRPVLRRSATSN